MLAKFLGAGDKKVLLSNFFSLLMLRGFQFLIPLITFPYLIRVIGIEKFGLVNFAFALSVFFGAVIQFGFGITITREIARNRESSIRLVKIYSATMVSSALLGLGCAVLFSIVVISVDRFNNELMLYALTFIYVAFQSLFPDWFFRGVEKMKYIALLSLGANCLSLTGILLFVRQENDFLLVPLFNAIAAFFLYVVSIVLIRYKFHLEFELPGLKEIGHVYRVGSHAFIAQFTPNLYNNAAVFLLGLFQGPSVVGLYAAATKVIDAVISIGYILASTFLPYLSRDIRKYGVFQKIMLYSGGVSTAIIFLFAEFISIHLFGSEYGEISNYIRLLAVAIFFGFTYLTYSSNYLMIVGHEVIARNIALYISLAALFYTAALIFSFGVYGAIASLLISRAALSCFSFLFYKRVGAEC
ncbi:hypothetical protein EQ832_08510 [Pseudomonas sp. ALS1131]|nr:oligosaccharide flippase family protein [Pseudomonas sp. ALS1131]TRO40101.1 hypothetical protein EQ832_08510 [Pseudomonas sp. ALS1131]